MPTRRGGTLSLPKKQALRLYKRERKKEDLTEVIGETRRENRENTCVNTLSFQNLSVLQGKRRGVVVIEAPRGKTRHPQRAGGNPQEGKKRMTTLPNTA